MAEQESKLQALQKAVDEAEAEFNKNPKDIDVVTKLSRAKGALNKYQSEQSKEAANKKDDEKQAAPETQQAAPQSVEEQKPENANPQAKDADNNANQTATSSMEQQFEENASTSGKFTYKAATMGAKITDVKDEKDVSLQSKMLSSAAMGATMGLASRAAGTVGLSWAVSGGVMAFTSGRQALNETHKNLKEYKQELMAAEVAGFMNEEGEKQSKLKFHLKHSAKAAWPAVKLAARTGAMIGAGATFGLPGTAAAITAVSAWQANDEVKKRHPDQKGFLPSKEYTKDFLKTWGKNLASSTVGMIAGYGATNLGANAHTGIPSELSQSYSDHLPHAGAGAGNLPNDGAGAGNGANVVDTATDNGTSIISEAHASGSMPNDPPSTTPDPFEGHYTDQQSATPDAGNHTQTPAETNPAPAETNHTQTPAEINPAPAEAKPVSAEIQTPAHTGSIDTAEDAGGIDYGTPLHSEVPTFEGKFEGMSIEEYAEAKEAFIDKAIGQCTDKNGDLNTKLFDKFMSSDTMSGIIDGKMDEGTDLSDLINKEFSVGSNDPTCEISADVRTQAADAFDRMVGGHVDSIDMKGELMHHYDPSADKIVTASEVRAAEAAEAAKNAQLMDRLYRDIGIEGPTPNHYAEQPAQPTLREAMEMIDKGKDPLAQADKTPYQGNPNLAKSDPALQAGHTTFNGQGSPSNTEHLAQGHNGSATQEPTLKQAMEMIDKGIDPNAQANNISAQDIQLDQAKFNKLGTQATAQNLTPQDIINAEVDNMKPPTIPSDANAHQTAGTEATPAEGKSLTEQTADVTKKLASATKTATNIIDQGSSLLAKFGVDIDKPELLTKGNDGLQRVASIISKISRA
jgi:hypothetical protein